MRDDRSAEWVSGVLCVALTLACFLSARSLALWIEPHLNAFSCGTAPTDWVFGFSHEPLSIASLSWLAGALLASFGVFLRRRQVELSALIILAIAPVIPVAMLAASAVALLLPFAALDVK